MRANQAPPWLRIGEVKGEFSSTAKFHEFVLKGNDQALAEFYKKGRRSPVLGDEAFRNGLMEKPVRVDREHPRYERVAVRPSVNPVLKALAKRYGVEVDDLMKGRRGKENAHKRGLRDIL